MAGKSPPPSGQSREERLKQALKANMAKRKSQARARTQGKQAANTAEQTGKDKSDG